MRPSLPFLLALVLLICACDEDDKPADPPTVFITPNFGNTDPEGELSTMVEIDAPGELATLTITTIVEDVRDEANAVTITPTTVGLTDTTFTYTHTETNKEIAGLTIDVEFLATDKQGQTGSSLYRVGINAPSVLIMPSGNFQHPISDGSGGSNSSTFFTSTNTQPTWTINQIDNEDVSTEIDFGYYYDSDAGIALFASIEDYPISNFGGMDTWSRRNNTTFRKTSMTTEEFDDAGFPEIYRAFNEGTSGTREQRTDGLSIGDIIAFETNADKEDGSKRGLIHVTDLQEGDDSDGFITVKIVFEN